MTVRVYLTVVNKYFKRHKMSFWKRAQKKKKIQLQNRQVNFRPFKGPCILFCFFCFFFRNECLGLNIRIIWYDEVISYLMVVFYSRCVVIVQNEKRQGFKILFRHINSLKTNYKCCSHLLYSGRRKPKLNFPISRIAKLKKK